MFYAISIENPLMVGGRGGMDNTKELKGILSKLGRGKGFFNISSGVSAKVRVQELLARQQIEATENVASQKINQTLETKGYKPQPNERLTTKNQYKQQDQQARKTLRETASKAAREKNNQIQKKVIYNVAKSTNTRKSSNIKEYLKKEKEIVKSKNTRPVNSSIESLTRDHTRQGAQDLLKNGEISLSNLESMIPPDTSNTFFPTSTIKDGAKYEFLLADGQKAIIRWHSPDPIAASKYSGSVSGTRWTAQIKIGNKQLKTDGTWTKNQSLNEVHIPIEGK